MKGTRLRSVFRESLGNLHREIQIALTSVPDDKKWVFLVGCYNSGTTLLAEILGQHPDISALPTEGHFITDQFVKDYDIGLPRMWVDREDVFRLKEGDTGPDPVRLKKEWCIRLDLDKPCLLEKSPPNGARTRWLQENFSNSYFIGIVRNPYAVSEGIRRKAEPHHLADGWPIDKCAYQWRRSNEVLMEDSEHLQRFILVSYEDLVEDPGSTLNRLTGFLGVDNYDAFDGARKWRIHERDDELSNLNQASIDKLSKEDIKIINDVAGNMIEQMGYKRL